MKNELSSETLRISAEVRSGEVLVSEAKARARRRSEGGVRPKARSDEESDAKVRGFGPK